jgi:hypothetical protein
MSEVITVGNCTPCVATTPGHFPSRRREIEVLLAAASSLRPQTLLVPEWGIHPYKTSELSWFIDCLVACFPFSPFLFPRVAVRTRRTVQFCAVRRRVINLGVGEPEGGGT